MQPAVNWLFEDEIFHEKTEDAVAVVKKFGDNYKVIPYFDTTKDTDFFPADSCVIVRGSMGCVTHLNHKLWTPSSWVKPNDFLCSHYYPYLRHLLFNKGYYFLPMLEVLEDFDALAVMHSDRDEGNTLFVRPDSGMKTFSGGVFDKESFRKEYTFTVKNRNCEPHLLCVIAAPREIMAEHRFVICEGKVVSGCRYMLNGELDIGPGYSGLALQVAEKVATDKFQVAPIYVADIAADKDDNNYLLELNGFNTASLYACDIKKVLTAARSLAIKEHAQMMEDMKD